MNSRVEKKYLIKTRDFHYLRSVLPSFLKTDIHGRENGYHVSSLYFDSSDFKSYYEKIDGDINKEKWRLRLYNHEEKSLHLEQKIKQGRLSSKHFFPMDHLHGREPKLLVHYQRLAYEDNQVRVTLDFDLSFSKAYLREDIFNDDCLAQKSDVMVLETKANQNQHSIELEQLIKKLSLKASAYSKYADGIRTIYDL